MCLDRETRVAYQEALRWAGRETWVSVQVASEERSAVPLGTVDEAEAW